MKALYLEVNKGERVVEIDLPDTIAPERKARIDAACRAIKAECVEIAARSRLSYRVSISADL